MKIKLMLLPLLIVPMLGGCSGTGNLDASNINGNLHIRFGNGDVVINAPGHPDAHIASNGDLRIGDNAVALTPPQRGLLKQLYGEAVAVRDDGIATGKAGAALGFHAIGAVFDGLMSGDSHKTDREMDVRSKTIETSALHLCSEIESLKATQGLLSAQLPAFQPYAVVRGEIHCDTHEDDDKSAQRDRIREDIRGTIRTVVRETVRSPSASTTATPSSSAAQ